MIVSVLMSYAYGQRIDFTEEAEWAGKRGVQLNMMADSGAFTAYTTGREITLTGYTAWLNKWHRHFSYVAPLDVIGDPRRTLLDALKLRDTTGLPVMGAFHCGSPMADLERQCDEFGFVGAGAGAVGFRHSRKAFMRWLVQVHRTARDHGALLHGFGLASPDYLKTLPWYSVDSSFWMQARGRGNLSLFDSNTGRWLLAKVGRPLPPAMRPLIRAYGGDPAAVQTPGFGRMGLRGATGRSEFEWLTLSSMRSVVELNTWLRRYRPEIPPPKGAPYPGPFYHLAVTGRTDLRMAVTAAQQCGAS